MLHATVAASFLLCLLRTAAADSATLRIIAPPRSREVAVHDAVQLYRAATHSNNSTHAIELYRASIERYPLAQAYNNLGLLLAAQTCDSSNRDSSCFASNSNDVREIALAVLAQGAIVALETNELATFASIESNIGHITREPDTKSVALCLHAIEHFDRALEVDPLHINALYNKASALYEMRDYGAAERLNRHILEIEPTHVGANTDLSAILFFTRRDIELAVRYQDVIIANTDSIVVKRAALVNKATMLRGNAQFIRALDAATQAHALSPESSLALATLVIAQRPLCLWQHRHALHSALIAHAIDELSDERSYNIAVSLLPFEATLMDVSDAFRKQLAVAASRQTEQRVTLGLAAPQVVDVVTAANATSRPVRPLRIGYLSYDFRDHAMGQLVLGFLELHDTNAVESICYSYGTNDGSEWRHRAEASCSTFRGIAALSDLDAATQVARDNVDILVDLMGHTTGARASIPALKPAHIVVNYLGYPGTTGSQATDFVVVDRIVLPPERAQTSMTEQVVYLPTTYQSNRWELEPLACMDELRDQPADAPALHASRQRDGYESDSMDGATHDRSSSPDWHEPPCRLASRTDHGLPETAVVFANFNTIHKLEPVAFSIWMRILHQVPASVLWLLDPGKFADAPTIIQTLQHEARVHGIHTSRIVFAPWLDRRAHQARLTLADIFLDTFIYTAHSTATDALHANVPVLTLCGDTFASRVAASLVQHALPALLELMVHSVKAFEDVAVLLGRQPKLRQRIRRDLAAHALASPLFDSRRTTQHLEAAYAIMHDLTHRVRVSQQLWPADTLTLGQQPPSHRQPATRYQVLVRPEASVTAIRDTANTFARVQRVVDTGLQYQQRGDIAVARYFYTHALQTAPTHGDALHLLATLEFAQGRKRRARALLQRVVQLHPNVALYRINAALAHVSLREDADAIEQLVQAVRLEPWHVSAFNQLVDLVLKTAQYDAVVELFHSIGGVILDVHFTNSTLAPSAMNDSRDRVNDADRERAFLRYSYALAKSGRAIEAITVLQDAITKHATYYRAGYNLVTLYNQQQLYRAGENWLIKVVCAESYANYETQGGARVRKLARPAGRRVVAIYCHEYDQAWWGHWGPSSLGTGLGGSEEAVVFLAAELHVLGYWVEVYGDPPAADLTTRDTRPPMFDNVAWYPHTAYDPDDTAVDVFVAWRYYASLVVGQNAHTRFLWLHDVPSRELLASRRLLSPDYISGVVCVSAFQASLLPRAMHERGLVVTTTNGLSPQFFADGTNRATHFVYGSAPNRGLVRVLEAWPRIHAAIPNATLAIYYGFTPAFNAWANTVVPDYAAWRRRIELLLQTLPGVTLVGAVGHAALARGYAAAGFYLYPTTFGETSAVSLMKAMAAGAVPITSRFLDSALNETCGAFDLGPQQPLTKTNAFDSSHANEEAATAREAAWLDMWVASIVDAVHDPRTHTWRKVMKAHARTTFLWAAVAQQWHDCVLQQVGR